jgi:hypothetical protein
MVAGVLRIQREWRRGGPAVPENRQTSRLLHRCSRAIRLMRFGFLSGRRSARIQTDQFIVFVNYCAHTSAEGVPEEGHRSPAPELISWPAIANRRRYMGAELKPAAAIAAWLPAVPFLSRATGSPVLRRLKSRAPHVRSHAKAPSPRRSSGAPKRGILVSPAALRGGTAVSASAHGGAKASDVRTSTIWPDDATNANEGAGLRARARPRPSRRWCRRSRSCSTEPGAASPAARCSARSRDRSRDQVSCN